MLAIVAGARNRFCNVSTVIESTKGLFEYLLAIHYIYSFGRRTCELAAEQVVILVVGITVDDVIDARWAIIVVDEFADGGNNLSFAYIKTTTDYSDFMDSLSIPSSQVAFYYDCTDSCMQPKSEKFQRESAK